jgi:hypothetical protein
VQRSVSRRRRLRLLALVIACGVIATIVVVTLPRSSHRGPAACTVTAAGVDYALTPDQAENAAIIAAAAHRLSLPDHAVTIGLAAALQESKLRNLPYGDRDSLGLFQQRPSQGWGSKAQIAQPDYAATAFFNAMRKISGWQTLDVADIVQRVQRSADGSAYAQWDGEARAYAAALTGETPAALRCSNLLLRHVLSAEQVSDQIQEALGVSALRPGITTAAGWQAASYLVARAQSDGITTVSFAGKTWTAGSGAWRPGGDATGRVTFAVVAQLPAR